MVFLAPLGVLRGFPAAAYRRTPHRKPLCGLEQNQKSSFLNRALCWLHHNRGWTLQRDGAYGLTLVLMRFSTIY